MAGVISRLGAAVSDRYQVERELGRGGMATVYLAHDLRHGRDVAIKVLHPDRGAALGSERFLSEIRTTARLQHPHAADFVQTTVSRRHYDVTPDGQRFLMVQRADGAKRGQVIVVENWAEEMRRKSRQP